MNIAARKEMKDRFVQVDKHRDLSETSKIAEPIAQQSTSSENAPVKLQVRVEIFRERCEARAILVEACVMELQEAVDGLQDFAQRSGLVDAIGQDAVQRMMAEAFGGRL